MEIRHQISIFHVHVSSMPTVGSSCMLLAIGAIHKMDSNPHQYSPWGLNEIYTEPNLLMTSSFDRRKSKLFDCKIYLYTKKERKYIARHFVLYALLAVKFKLNPGVHMKLLSKGTRWIEKIVKVISKIWWSVDWATDMARQVAGDESFDVSPSGQERCQELRSCVNELAWFWFHSFSRIIENCILDISLGILDWKHLCFVWWCCRHSCILAAIWHCTKFMW